MICDFKKTSPCNISYIKKLPPTPTEPVVEKPVLFTTEDGVGIRHGEKYWYIGGGYKIMMGVAGMYAPTFTTYGKRESAEKYVYESRSTLVVTDNSDVACLSLNDLLELWEQTPLTPYGEKGVKASPMYKRLEQRISQKLNK